MSEWRPHPKQVQALKSKCFEVLYGGARGGGKTDAGIMWLTYPYRKPYYRALVVRQNATDLNDWIDRARGEYRHLGAKLTGASPVFEFPSGAKIYTGHLKDENAYTKYQGHEYHRMLIEELTQISTKRRYEMLISSCRSTCDIQPRIFATANPGGQGHTWVKKRFVDPALPGTEFTAMETGRKRVFISATIDDNPTLIEKDPDYVKFLDGLPDDLRNAWRLGSWDLQKVKGAIYQDEIEKARKDHRIGFVETYKDRGVTAFFDLGMSDDQALLIAQRGEGRAVNIIDSDFDTYKSWDWWEALLTERGYKYDEIVLPHDGTKKNPQTLMSFKKHFEKAGFKVRVLTRTKDPWGDIVATRAFFQRLYINEMKTEHFLDCIANYRREFDENNEVFKNVAKHDWTSHFADSLRYLATGWRDKQPEIPRNLELRVKNFYNDQFLP